MENLPNKIYLNLGDLSEEEFNDTDFNDLSEITWSEDDVQGRNVQYVRKKVFINRVIKYLIFNTGTTHYSFGDRREFLNPNFDEVIEDIEKYLEES